MAYATIDRHSDLREVAVRRPSDEYAAHMGAIWIRARDWSIAIDADETRRLIADLQAALPELDAIDADCRAIVAEREAEATQP